MVTPTIFPLRAINDDGSCTCSLGAACSNVGKCPDYPYSTCEPGEIIKGRHGHGLCTGVRSGVFVVDLDVKPEEGIDGLSVLRSFGVIEHDTTVVRTHSGGWHLYFLLPDFVVYNSQRSLGPGIDVRGEGGFVVVPGSRGRSGKTYDLVIDAEPTQAPSWLLERIRAAQERTREVQAKSDVVPLVPGTEEFKRAADEAIEYTKSAAPCVSGEGGDTQLFRVVQILSRRYRMPDAAVRIIIEREYNPRCVPPWSDQELHERLTHKLEESHTKGVVTEGFFPSPDFVANLAVTSMPLAVREVVVPSEGKPFRKVKSPDHVYSHTPGDTESFEQTPVSMSMMIHLLHRHKDWYGVLQFDMFKRRLIAVDPPVKLDLEEGHGLTREDVTRIRTWFERRGFKVKVEDVESAVRAAAKMTTFHPIREYLEALPVVHGTSTLDGLAVRAFKSPSRLAPVYIRKALIGAVARIFEPGAKHDDVIVLQGDEGYHKSQAIEALFGRENTTDEYIQMGNRDGALSLRGFWGVELAELASMLRTDAETTKGFLSRVVDSYRAFGREDQVWSPRQNTFWGSTNSEDTLRDPTGDRRFQIVEISGHIDLEYLRANRDLIWAEAVAAYRAGGECLHWLTPEEKAQQKEANEDFREVNEWEQIAGDFLAGKKVVKNTFELYSRLMPGEPVGKCDRKMQRELGTILRKLGCKRRTVGGEYGWWTPEKYWPMKPQIVKPLIPPM